ncbi:hypothetical protein AQUCO_10900010v1 [Aquilegia coerulea]|uniref:Uncharacterized protein n=1 Tax=Aquilegia coerulea TaxID=218851 RepID=A0A2G5C311_AQUCA|nr:hypothetical protein AQUCO_10900010v1 [Aquilegia coerulea]
MRFVKFKVEEQLAEFLHTIGHNQNNQVINHNFTRSGKMISQYFHVVLKAILSLHNDLVKQPTHDMETPQKIQSDLRFFLFFKDCVGAIDGTHVRVNVPNSICNRFHGRKDKPTQNILAVVSFDLKFTYVLAGWEGSTHDTRVFEDALKRPNELVVLEDVTCCILYNHIMGVDPNDALILQTQNEESEQENEQEEEQEDDEQEEEGAPTDATRLTRREQMEENKR